MQMAVSAAVMMASLVMPRGVAELQSRPVDLSGYRPRGRRNMPLPANRKTRRRLAARYRARVDEPAYGARPKLIQACSHNARVRGH